MPFFEHDGLHFHFREGGAGLPFLFQHGLGADTSQTFGLFKPPPGVRMVTMDCRGHGETRPLGPEEKLNIPQFAADVRALLDHLGFERAVIGGISMGAATALHLALEAPERVAGLILSRPAWLDERREASFEVFGRIASLIREHGAWEGARNFQDTEEYVRIRSESPDNATSLLAQFAHPRAEETVAKLERVPQHSPAHARTEWRRLTMPTLVLANRRDAIHPFEFGEEYARHIPGAEFRELTPKSTSKEQHAAEVQRYVAEFLSRFAGENRAK